MHSAGSAKGSASGVGMDQLDVDRFGEFFDNYSELQTLLTSAIAMHSGSDFDEIANASKRLGSYSDNKTTSVSSSGLNMAASGGLKKSASRLASSRCTPLKPPKKYRTDDEDRQILRCKRSLNFYAGTTCGGGGSGGRGGIATDESTFDSDGESSDARNITSPKGGASAKTGAATERRNLRERKRVKQINATFQTLRNHLPSFCWSDSKLHQVRSSASSASSLGGSAKKTSKVDTLRTACEYIYGLQSLIKEHDRLMEVAAINSAECLSMLSSTADLRSIDATSSAAAAAAPNAGFTSPSSSSSYQNRAGQDAEVNSLVRGTNAMPDSTVNPMASDNIEALFTLPQHLSSPHPHQQQQLQQQTMHLGSVGFDSGRSLQSDVNCNFPLLYCPSQDQSVFNYDVNWLLGV